MPAAILATLVLVPGFAFGVRVVEWHLAIEVAIATMIVGTGVDNAPDECVPRSRKRTWHHPPWHSSNCIPRQQIQWYSSLPCAAIHCDCSKSGIGCDWNIRRAWEWGPRILVNQTK